MNQYTMLLQREYWEHKRALVQVPVGLALFICAMALLAVVLMQANSKANIIDFSGDRSVPFDATPLDFYSGAQPIEGDEQGDSGMAASDDAPSPEFTWEFEGDERQVQPWKRGFDRPQLPFEAGSASFEIGIASFFIGLAWLFAFSYSTASLSADRKDNSVLFWKSLPVGDGTTVISKLAFAGLGFPAVAAVVSWLCYWVLALVALLAVMLVDNFTWADTSFSLMHGVEMIAYSLMIVVYGFLWGAPFFALVLLCSAWSKNSAGLLFILGLVVLGIAEAIVFRGARLVFTVLEQSPYQVLAWGAELQSFGAVSQRLFIDNGARLLFAWVAMAGVLYTTMWLRRYRFER